MASSKAKVGVNSETNSMSENKSNASSSAGETSANNWIYCLDDLETIATVGEFQLHIPHMSCPVQECCPK